MPICAWLYIHWLPTILMLPSHFVCFCKASKNDFGTKTGLYIQVYLDLKVSKKGEWKTHCLLLGEIKVERQTFSYKKLYQSLVVGFVQPFLFFTGLQVYRFTCFLQAWKKGFQHQISISPRVL